MACLCIKFANASTGCLVLALAGRRTEVPLGWTAEERKRFGLAEGSSIVDPLRRARGPGTRCRQLGRRGLTETWLPVILWAGGQ